MLTKTLWVRIFPFPSFPRLLPSSFFYLYFHIFSRPRLRNLRECLSSLAGPGGEFWAERVRAILVIMTLYICSPLLLTPQSAAPAGGRPVRPHHLATPSRRHCQGTHKNNDLLATMIILYDSLSSVPYSCFIFSWHNFKIFTPLNSDQSLLPIVQYTARS